jgi:hypothetical protein
MRYVAMLLGAVGMGLVFCGSVALASGGGGPHGRVVAGCNCSDCAKAPVGCSGTCGGQGCLAACGCNNVLIPQCNCNR